MGEPYRLAHRVFIGVCRLRTLDMAKYIQPLPCRGVGSVYIVVLGETHRSGKDDLVPFRALYVRLRYRIFVLFGHYYAVCEHRFDRDLFRSVFFEKETLVYKGRVKRNHSLFLDK